LSARISAMDSGVDASSRFIVNRTARLDPKIHDPFDHDAMP
jgi:hypothetical protein